MIAILELDSAVVALEGVDLSMSWLVDLLTPDLFLSPIPRLGLFFIIALLVNYAWGVYRDDETIPFSRVLIFEFFLKPNGLE